MVVIIELANSVLSKSYATSSSSLGFSIVEECHNLELLTVKLDINGKCDLVTFDTANYFISYPETIVDSFIIKIKLRYSSGIPDLFYLDPLAVCC